MKKIVCKFVGGSLLCIMMCMSFYLGLEAKSLGYRWQSINSPVYFYCNFNSYWKGAIQGAMTTWNNVKHPSTGAQLVPMQFTSNSGSANKIRTGSGNWLGYANVTNSGNSIQSVEVLFNTRDYSFEIGNVSGHYDIQSVAEHELGHAIGIAHCHELNNTCTSITCTNNVMNNTIPEGKVRRILQDYDISSKKNIYVYGRY